MAVTLALTDGYVTIPEADIYLSLDANWQAADDEVKQDSIMWARYYLESNFTYDLELIDAIDDEAKLANSVLAADYLVSQKIFGDSEAAIKKQTLKADVLTKSVEYETGSSYKPPSVGKAFALMSLVATKKNTNIVFLMRS